MSDDDNYTIEDDDDAPTDTGGVASERGPGGPGARATGLLVLGLVTIAGAAFCATTQTGFQEGPAGRGTFFVTALTLPLSITGALLTVAAVCVLILRLRLPRGSE